MIVYVHLLMMISGIILISPQNAKMNHYQMVYPGGYCSEIYQQVVINIPIVFQTCILKAIV